MSSDGIVRVRIRVRVKVRVRVRVNVKVKVKVKDLQVRFQIVRTHYPRYLYYCRLMGLLGLG